MAKKVVKKPLAKKIVGKKSVAKPKPPVKKVEGKIKKIKTTKVSSLSKIGLGEEKSYFMENLSMLLASGMDVLSSLKAIQAGIKSPVFKKIIVEVEHNIDSGSSISKALSDAELFPEHVISLVRIGEETGRLSENLKVVIIQQQKERSFRSKVQSAMMYPVLVLSLTAIVGIGVAWFILPRLSSVFSQLKLELPLMTKGLIGVGNFIGAYGLMVVPSALLIFFILMYFVFIFPKTKFLGQAVLFKIPGIGRLIQQVQIAQMGYILGTLLDAGLPIVNAVDSLDKATTVRRYKKLFAFLKQSVSDGNSIKRTFDIYPKSDKLIPIPIQQMIAASEQSGRLPETLLKIGEIFEEKTENTTKNLAVILEPIMLIIIWLGVVAVALAVILPIYSLIGGLNQTSTPPPPKPPITVVKPPAVNKLIIKSTAGESVEVFSQPAIDSEVVLTIFPEEIYKYQNQQNGWYEIVLPNGNVGWVAGEAVELIIEN